MSMTSLVSNSISVFKSYDQSLDSTSTLQDDAHLKFAMDANEIWQFEFVAFVETNNTVNGFKISINGPVSPVDLRAHVYLLDPTGAAFTTTSGKIITTYDDAVQDTDGNLATIAFVSGTVQNGTTAGNLVLRWAQVTPHSQYVKVNKNSYLIARRISERNITYVFKTISGGNDFANAIVLDGGKTVSWGGTTGNALGQLGDGTQTVRLIPTVVTGNHSFVEVGAAGDFFAVARKPDGTAWTWGQNDFGELGDNTVARRSSPVSVVGGHSFVAISGNSNATALKSDGTAWTWGLNTEGYLGDGTVTPGGGRSSPVSVIGEHSFVQVAPNCGKKADGSVWCWGPNGSGEVGDNTTSNRSSPVSVVGGHSFVDISRFSMGLKADGSAWLWGSGLQGRLGDGTTANKSSPVSVIGDHSFVEISAGITHVMARKTDGSVWSWGDNAATTINGLGQLGDGTIISKSSPVSVLGNHSFVEISAGSTQSFGRKANGSLWGWGDGGVGDGTTLPRSSPVLILGSV